MIAQTNEGSVIDGRATPAAVAAVANSPLKCFHRASLNPRILSGRSHSWWATRQTKPRRPLL